MSWAWDVHSIRVRIRNLERMLAHPMTSKSNRSNIKNVLLPKWRKRLEVLEQQEKQHETR